MFRPGCRRTHGRGQGRALRRQQEERIKCMQGPSFLFGGEEGQSFLHELRSHQQLGAVKLNA